MLIKRVHKFDSLSRTKSGHGRQSKNGNEVVKRREMRELEEMFSELKPMALHPSLDTTAAATNSAHSHGFATKNGNNKVSQTKVLTLSELFISLLLDSMHIPVS